MARFLRRGTNMGKYFSKAGKPRRPVKCYGSVYPPGGSLFPVKCTNTAVQGDLYCKRCLKKK